MGERERDFYIGGHKVRINQVHDSIWASFYDEENSWVSIPLPDTISEVPEALGKHERAFFLTQIKDALKDLYPEV